MKVSEVVPFFAVKDMKKSLAFYVDGLGFELKTNWIDDDVVRWCRLQIGDAGLMLQQFGTEGPNSRQFNHIKGSGVSLYFFCDDAVEIYRDVTSRGINAAEPVVGNRLWVTTIINPDGFEVNFESPTDEPEETRLSDLAPRA